MIKFVDRGAKAECQRTLVERVKYLEDEKAAKHLNIEILPSKNYGCYDQSPEAFVKAVKQSQILGEKRRDSETHNRKSKGGNPTKDLFLELIYSSQKFSWITADERGVIEKTLTDELKGCAMRLGWHINKETGRADLHILMGARDKLGKATKSSRYGSGKQTFNSRRDDLNDQFTDMINLTRDTVFEPVHVIYRRNNAERKGRNSLDLAHDIAEMTKDDITKENIGIAISALGHKVMNDPLTAGTVHVVFENGEKLWKWQIKKLLLQIAEIQLEIGLENTSEEGGNRGGNRPVKMGASGDSKKADEPHKPQSINQSPKPAMKEAKKTAPRKKRKSSKDRPKGPNLPGGY